LAGNSPARTGGVGERKSVENRKINMMNIYYYQ